MGIKAEKKVAIVLFYPLILGLIVNIENNICRAGNKMEISFPFVDIPWVLRLSIPVRALKNPAVLVKIIYIILCNKIINILCQKIKM